MNVKFLVVRYPSNKEVARFDSYEEAEKKIQSMFQLDMLGDTELYIQKLYTAKSQ